METRVKKRGNSLALRIPKLLALEAGLREETLIELVLEDGKLSIIPIAEPELNLDQLLAQVTKDNLHDEVDTGPATGAEAW